MFIINKEHQFLPIYLVVEKVLDFADIVVDSKQQKYDFGNVDIAQR